MNFCLEKMPASGPQGPKEVQQAGWKKLLAEKKMASHL